MTKSLPASTHACEHCGGETFAKSVGADEEITEREFNQILGIRSGNGVSS